MRHFFFILLLAQSSSYAQSIFSNALADSALTLTKHKIEYDPTYFVINYPNGDVPKNKGVCTDVVIRAYRTMGVDLQKEVHEDMEKYFKLYPKKWGLAKPDKNIDHRRVPNLMMFFSRFGHTKTNSNNAGDYTPGDIVCWDLGSGITHIGLVSNVYNSENIPLIIHNIGAGQVLENALFKFKIIGHYCYEK